MNRDELDTPPQTSEQTPSLAIDEFDVRATKRSKSNEGQDLSYEEDATTGMIIAIHFTNQQIGVACYDEVKNIILLDIIYACNEDYEETLAQLKMQTCPTLFLLHPNIITNKSLLEILSQGLDGTPNIYEHRILKTSSWNEKANKSLIQNSLSIKKDGKVFSKAEVYYELAACVDVENPHIIQALGALLHHLQDHVFNLDEGKVIVGGFQELPNTKLLRIDKNSLYALQIFSDDFHPNWLKTSGKNKEGFSLFSMFDRAYSIPGRFKLKDWMHRPLYDKDAIESRQKGVAFTSSFQHVDLIKELGAQLKHLHDMSRIILRIKKVQANYQDWCKINTSLAASVSIITTLRDYLHNLREDSDDAVFVISMCQDVDLVGLNDIRQHLLEWINFDETSKMKEVIINEGKDPELDDKREIYKDLEGYLIQAAEKILEVTPLIEALSVEYVPQLGYLATISDDDVRLLRTEGWINESVRGSTVVSEGPESMVPQTRPSTSNSALASCNAATVSPVNQFTFIFTHEDKHYFKHSIVCRLDETIGDVRSDIQDRQRQILLQLEEGLLDVEASMVQATSSIATLDAFISLGIMAKECNLTVPQLHEDPVIVIKNGRHLLQELTVDSFVPNDTLLTPNKNVALITGPNSSGKSIYLKQVGLIVYLAHIGSFVPCDQAIIGLTDKILTRIKTTESISIPQSSFTMDLTQISKMLRYRTDRSLCLIDEFGKGTNPADGMSLLAAIIEDFTEEKSNAIFVLHFTEILFDNNIDAINMESILCFRMETLNDEEKAEGDEDEELVPLYKLKFGVETCSQGIACAAKMGVAPAVIERAKYYRDCLQNNRPAEALPFKSSSEDDVDAKDVEIVNFFLSIDNWETADEDDLVKLESLVRSRKVN